MKHPRSKEAKMQHQGAWIGSSPCYRNGSYLFLILQIIQKECKRSHLLHMCILWDLQYLIECYSHQGWASLQYYLQDHHLRLHLMIEEWLFLLILAQVSFNFLHIEATNLCLKFFLLSWLSWFVLFWLGFCFYCHGPLDENRILIVYLVQVNFLVAWDAFSYWLCIL
jgi:hypothetical protein